MDVYALIDILQKLPEVEKCRRVNISLLVVDTNTEYIVPLQTAHFKSSETFTLVAQPFDRDRNKRR